MCTCRLLRIATGPARALLGALAQLCENSLHDFDPILPDTDCALLEADHEVIEPCYTVADLFALREILWQER